MLRAVLCVAFVNAQQDDLLSFGKNVLNGLLDPDSANQT